MQEILEFMLRPAGAASILALALTMLLALIVSRAVDPYARYVGGTAFWVTVGWIALFVPTEPEFELMFAVVVAAGLGLLLLIRQSLLSAGTSSCAWKADDALIEGREGRLDVAEGRQLKVEHGNREMALAVLRRVPNRIPLTGDELPDSR